MMKFFASLAIVLLGLSLSTNGAFASTIGNGQGEGQGLDINAYCVHTNQGPDSSVITGTQDWTCSPNGKGSAIKLHEVCKFEHPGLNSVKQLVTGDPLTYVCLK